MSPRALAAVDVGYTLAVARARATFDAARLAGERAAHDGRARR